MNIECLVFVALVISLVWMVLYCFYLKNRLHDWEQYSSRVNAEQMETRRLLRALGAKLGYQLPCNLEWEKK